MNANVAFMAPGSPPLTGESKNLQFFSSTILANFLESTGDTELISTTIEFSCNPLRIPFSSESKEFTIIALGTIVIITLLFSAISLGDEAVLAPASFKTSTAVGFIS